MGCERKRDGFYLVLSQDTPLRTLRHDVVTIHALIRFSTFEWQTRKTPRAHFRNFYKGSEPKPAAAAAAAAARCCDSTNETCMYDEYARFAVIVRFETLLLKPRVTETLSSFIGCFSTTITNKREHALS